MSEEIRPGDWVRIFKPSPCCNSFASVNMVFQVIGSMRSRHGYCSGCNKAIIDDGSYVELDDGTGILRSRLKKIPPLSEPEDQTEERKLEV